MVVKLKLSNKKIIRKSRWTKLPRRTEKKGSNKSRQKKEGRRKKVKRLSRKVMRLSKRAKGLQKLKVMEPLKRTEKLKRQMRPTKRKKRLMRMSLPGAPELGFLTPRSTITKPPMQSQWVSTRSWCCLTEPRS